MTLEYDYGASWKLEIELLSITEMKCGAGAHYPYVTDGKGKGIIENIPPYELVQIIAKTDMDGILPKITDVFSREEREWDYRDFDLQYCNVFYKDNVLRVQMAYEEYV